MEAPAVFVEAAAPDDVATLVALERLCFSHPWTPRNFTDAMADPPRSRVVVVRTAAAAAAPERGIVAYCVYEVVAGELHVHNLAVHPVHRQRGLGRRLMELVLRVGRHRGAVSAFLEVRRSNRAALSLYGGLGFQVVSTRRNYYAHPTEDALVMSVDLS
jgi:[ribosomal protein S18]-alanine N-acetyltransferase